MKFTRIDRLYLGDHYYLAPDDRCFFMREYTARKGFDFSETNQIIHNIKKSPDRRGKPEWVHKEKGLERVADELRSSLNLRELRKVTIVPVPPHTVKDDPLYDDRILRILGLVDGGLDVRELVIQSSTIDPSHRSAERPSPTALRANYRIDESLCSPPPTSIIIFDDLVTAGAHFRAIEDMLRERFPGIQIYGIFYARRVLDPSD